MSEKTRDHIERLSVATVVTEKLRLSDSHFKKSRFWTLRKCPDTIFSIFSPLAGGLLDHIFLFLFGLFHLFLCHLCCRPWIPSLTPVNPGFGAGKKHLLKKCPSAQVISQPRPFKCSHFHHAKKGTNSQFLPGTVLIYHANVVAT